MCAVSNNTIELAKQRDIKYNILCQDHQTTSLKKQKESLKLDAAYTQDSDHSESRMLTDSDADLHEAKKSISLKRTQPKPIDTSLKKQKFNPESKVALQTKVLYS
jgi:hypothetical protein